MVFEMCSKLQPEKKWVNANSYKSSSLNFEYRLAAAQKIRSKLIDC